MVPGRLGGVLGAAWARKRHHVHELQEISENFVKTHELHEYSEISLKTASRHWIFMEFSVHPQH